MAIKQVNIKLIRDNAQLPTSYNGNWYDCYVSGVSIVPSHAISKGKPIEIPDEPEFTTGVIHYHYEDVVIVYLGFATDMGKGYEGHLIPRSGTFRKHKLMLTNSMGLIDDTYCGDNDEWKAMFYATSPGSIKIGDRLLQMTIQKSNPKFSLSLVTELGNEDRGGYGSTGE